MFDLKSMRKANLESEANQIEKGSSSPAAGAVVAFRRRPPVHRSTDEVLVRDSNGRRSIDMHCSVGALRDGPRCSSAG